MSDSTALITSIKEVLTTGFREDIGFGDITSDSIDDNSERSGIFSSKDHGVIAGLGTIKYGYQLLNPSVSVHVLKNDGDIVSPGDKLARVTGPSQVLLTGERVILNILQHLSGVATVTRKAVQSLNGSKTRICDTRKTLPGLRSLQKYAVRCGGGYNHRLRLDDGVIIKDNHIIAAGGIKKAVQSVRHHNGLMIKIEVECESERDVLDAIDAGADIIMLDNKSPDEVIELRTLIPDNILVELSGGVTAETVGRYKDCGVDYISIGSLTHSVPALDISFNLEGGKKERA